jgi:hypothetical protein
LFAPDAIFQGLHPYTVGPVGVAEYYASLPTDMTAAYTLRETRALGDDLVLGYLTVGFGFSHRATISRDSDGWRIARYQVSRLDEYSPRCKVMAGPDTRAVSSRSLDERLPPRRAGAGRRLRPRASRPRTPGGWGAGG